LLKIAGLTSATTTRECASSARTAERFTINDEYTNLQGAIALKVDLWEIVY